MDRFRPYAAASLTAGPVAGLGMQFSELIGSLSHALDSPRASRTDTASAAAGSAATSAGSSALGDAELRELYYTLLLKDLGCSSNAARICELYLTDDLSFKRDFKTVGDSLAADVLRFVFSHTGLKAGLAERLRSVAQHPSQRPANHRRADPDPVPARRRHRPPAALRRRGRRRHRTASTSTGTGSGRPEGLAGRAIPLYSRIALLAQVIDVFHTLGGRRAALCGSCVVAAAAGSILQLVRTHSKRVGERAGRSGRCWPRPRSSRRCSRSSRAPAA